MSDEETENATDPTPAVPADGGLTTSTPDAIEPTDIVGGNPGVRYWQIAAGSLGREYTDHFLAFGLAFVGGRQQIATVGQVRTGDRVILKRGLGQIVAAGVVVERDGKCCGDASREGDGARDWLRDHDGWDLPGYCFVEWHREPTPRAVSGLTRSTIQRVKQRHLRTAADEIIQTAPACPVEPEPGRAADLTDDEMLTSLVRSGLRPASAEELTGTLRRIRLLARYYYHSCDWRDIREHEARTFLIVPFLLALGWSEQQIKIELGVQKARRNRTGGGKIDVACFRRPYHRVEGKPNNDDCVLILESKGFGQGLDYAHEQGKEYATIFPKCEVVVASNGYCYKAYRRKPGDSGFESKPSAYLNLLRPRKCYPLDPGKNNGGLELLAHLMPQRA